MRRKLLLGAVLFIVVAGGAYYAVAMPRRPAPPPPPSTVSLGSFVTNLSGSTHYIKVAVSIVVVGKQAGGTVTKDKVQVDDAILTTLRGESAQDVSGSQGVAALKKKLKGQLQQRLTGVTVKSVLFTQFVVE